MWGMNSSCADHTRLWLLLSFDLLVVSSFVVFWNNCIFLMLHLLLLFQSDAYVGILWIIFIFGKGKTFFWVKFTLEWSAHGGVFVYIIQFRRPVKALKLTLIRQEVMTSAIKWLFLDYSNWLPAREQAGLRHAVFQFKIIMSVMGSSGAARENIFRLVSLWTLYLVICVGGTHFWSQPE